MKGTVVEWVLRIASACVYAGHGLCALRAHPPWLVFFTAVGLTTDDGYRWMPWVGVLDLVLALMVLVRPTRVLLLWMVAWAVWTALLRPIAGQSWLEFVERGGNWGTSLALLFVRGWPRSWRDLAR